MRKISALLLTLATLFSLLAVPAAAAAASPQLVTSGTAAATQEIKLTGIPNNCQSFQATFTLSNASADYGFVADNDLMLLPGIYTTYQHSGSSVTVYVTAKSGVLTDTGSLTLGTLSSADGSTFTVTGMSGVKLLDSYTGDIELGGSSGGSGSSSTARAITIKASTGGSVTASAAQAVQGRTITLTATAQEDYVLESIAVTNSAGRTVALTDLGGGKYTFTMPSSAVTVTAVFAAQSGGNGGATGSQPFVDVPAGAWYEEAVQYVYENGLMSGTGDGRFSPEVTTSRAMIVTILYRQAGSPAVTGSAAFTDVEAGTWYTDAVTWASANGIVSGYGEGKFGPNDPITREQMAAILCRYASYKGMDVTKRADLSAFSDAGQVSDYALETMRLAVAEGLITGTSETTLSPAGSATRAQAALILMRFAALEG
mgnify:CR=1 FL=1